jgi:hypothetical protein
MVNGGCWVDSIGNLWLGICPSANGVGSGFIINTLWKYNIAGNTWTWVKGPNVLADQVGNYGVQNISAPTNIPGGRDFQNCWSRQGELWMFGGFGQGSNPGKGQLNDLWRFIPCYTNTIIPANTTAAANYTLCHNGTTNLSASGTGTITWYDIYNNALGSGTLFATPTLTTNQTNANLSTPHTFLFGDNTSCLLSSVTVSVYPNPTLNITATPSVICSGASSTLNAISAAAFYNWNTSQTTITISVSPTITSVYNVTVTNFPTGCTTTGSKTVNVNPLPFVTTSTSNSLLCAGQAATLTASGANSYTWNPGGTGSVIAVSPSVTTVYTLTGKDINGCVNSSSFTQSVSACTGMDVASTGSATGIIIYPNPTSGVVIIKAQAGLQIQVYNVIGELILNTELKTETIELDLRGQTNGIYFIRIGSVTKKIIKE